MGQTNIALALEAVTGNSEVKLAPELPVGSRILQFPNHRSLGRVFAQDAGIQRHIKDYLHWNDGTEDKWEFLGEAKGDLVVPRGQRVRLVVSKNGWRNLSGLSKLAPDDLYDLQLRFMPADDRCMPHIGRLAGLRVLNLMSTEVGDEGLRHLRGLTSLERLFLPNGVTNAGLAHVARVTTLKGLYFKGNHVTDAGLVHLARLGQLEELELGGSTRDAKGNPISEHISDNGLEHLSQLPRLHYLFLWGRFTDRALVHIAAIPSLRTLNLDQLPITNRGLEYLSSAKQLEALDLGSTQVTDKGLIYLKALPRLKKLNVTVKTKHRRNPPITDMGAAHLKQIKTLEQLSFAWDALTDAGLAHLSELDRLKYLSVGCATISELTDEGIRHLTRLQSLEELHVGGKAITSEGISNIARLPRLRRLRMLSASADAEALARLAGLKNLEYLNLTAPAISFAAVNKLKNLPNLTHLDCGYLVRDDGPLQLTGLPRLDNLALRFHEKAKLRDEDVGCLAKMKQLKWLQIGTHHGLTDEGLAQLAGLTALERLVVGGANLTDPGLSHLSSMKRMDLMVLAGNFAGSGLQSLEGLTGLRSLTINSCTKIDPAAVVRLRKSLPYLYKLTVDDERAIAPKQKPGRPLRAGDMAEPFSLETVEGKKITLEDYRGKGVLLYFWATWCSPCVASTPTLKAFHQHITRRSDRFAMISLSLDDNQRVLTSFLEKHTPAWPQARIGADSKIAAAYGVDGVPAYVIIDPDGKIISVTNDLRKAAADIGQMLDLP